jgi:histone-lysine N-methyltransferase EZH2
MHRSKALLIGRSDVGGWGVFTKNALKAGDFIEEYVGEAISQEEADRRGMICDARDRSYLFVVASDLVIDGDRKGNKSRFLNHSDNPNVQPKGKLLLVKEFVFLWHN